MYVAFKQGFGSGFIWYGSGSSILGWIPIRIQSGSRVFYDQNCEKIYSWKKLNFLNFLNFFYFSGSFLPSRIRIRIRIPTTDYEFGSGSTDEFGSNPDSNPCLEDWWRMVFSSAKVFAFILYLRKFPEVTTATVITKCQTIEKQIWGLFIF